MTVILPHPDTLEPLHFSLSVMNPDHTSPMAEPFRPALRSSPQAPQAPQAELPRGLS